MKQNDSLPIVSETHSEQDSKEIVTKSLNETLDDISKLIPKTYASNFNTFRHKVLRSKKFYKRLSKFEPANLKDLLLKYFSKKYSKRVKNEKQFLRIFSSNELRFIFSQNARSSKDCHWWKLE